MQSVGNTVVRDGAQSQVRNSEKWACDECMREFVDAGAAKGGEMEQQWCIGGDGAGLWAFGRYMRSIVRGRMPTLVPDAASGFTNIRGRM